MMEGHNYAACRFFQRKTCEIPAEVQNIKDKQQKTRFSILLEASRHTGTFKTEYDILISQKLIQKIYITRQHQITYKTFTKHVAQL